MRCIGCDQEFLMPLPAAWAVMHQKTFEELQIAPTLLGRSEFHGAPICRECYVDPAHRTRVVKAHFALPGTEGLLVSRAGSTDEVKG